MAPEAKSVEIIYSSSEVNSEVQVALTRDAAATENLTVVEKTITTTSQLLQAAQLMNADAIYIPHIQ